MSESKFERHIKFKRGSRITLTLPDPTIELTDEERLEYLEVHAVPAIMIVDGTEIVIKPPPSVLPAGRLLITAPGQDPRHYILRPGDPPIAFVYRASEKRWVYRQPAEVEDAEA